MNAMITNDDELKAARERAEGMRTVRRGRALEAVEEEIATYEALGRVRVGIIGAPAGSYVEGRTDDLRLVLGLVDKLLHPMQTWAQHHAGEGDPVRDIREAMGGASATGAAAAAARALDSLPGSGAPRPVRGGTAFDRLATAIGVLRDRDGIAVIEAVRAFDAFTAAREAAPGLRLDLAEARADAEKWTAAAMRLESEKASSDEAEETHAQDALRSFVDALPSSVPGSARGPIEAAFDKLEEAIAALPDTGDLHVVVSDLSEVIDARLREVRVFATAWRDTVREHAAIVRELPRIVDDKLEPLVPLDAVGVLRRVYEAPPLTAIGLDVKGHLAPGSADDFAKAERVACLRCGAVLKDRHGSNTTGACPGWSWTIKPENVPAVLAPDSRADLEPWCSKCECVAEEWTSRPVPGERGLTSLTVRCHGAEETRHLGAQAALAPFFVPVPCVSPR